MKILLINGPNLQLLGVREPGIYGGDTLPEIVARVRKAAEEAGYELADFQSNHEGDIVDRIGSARADGFAGIVMNPAAYTHTSVAIRDALAGVDMEGVTGRIVFDENGDAIKDIAYINMIQDGAFVFVKTVTLD